MCNGRIAHGLPREDLVEFENRRLRIPLHHSSGGPGDAPVRAAVRVQAYAADVAHERWKILVVREGVEHLLDGCPDVDRFADIDRAPARLFAKLSQWHIHRAACEK